MAEKREYTKHQLKIIDNYYKNADARASQNLQEIVTELYLATSEKKRKQLWEYNLGVSHDDFNDIFGPEIQRVTIDFDRLLDPKVGLV